MIKQSKNNKNNSRGHLPLWITLSVLLLVAALFFALVLPKLTPTKQMPEIAPSMPYSVPGFTMLEEVSGAEFDNGLSVLCAGKFSGFYLEDMSDDQVKDVLAIVVHNSGDTMVEYGKIELPIDGKTAVFTFTGLSAGSSVLVQEQNRMTWSGRKTGDFVCKEIARPVELIFDFGADFKLYLSDGVINIENISGQDITSDVKLFYKNFEYGLFMGGITYKTTFAGGIKADEIRQNLTEHFWEDTSLPLYMTYDK